MVMTPITEVRMCVHITQLSAVLPVRCSWEFAGMELEFTVMFWRKKRRCSLIPVCTVKLPIKLVEYLFETQLKNPAVALHFYRQPFHSSIFTPYSL